ncbi:hypothetical protein WICMUC_005113 [Wickerhamomyces mucosus]|uniref:Mid2 domain-containing protein n=1 Tax=Wickerhamomyces mucosus TaxID=1378264 RepID=A0A9P8PD06_9ASCO|nr:hypothetical protein WICMUC_005113 [Wickerhamomyces mucosus]
MKLKSIIGSYLLLMPSIFTVRTVQSNVITTFPLNGSTLSTDVITLYKRDSSSIYSSSSDSGVSTSITSTSNMPKIEITSSTVTISASSYSATFTPVVPTGSNPNIHINTLPEGMTFIAVGSVLGLIFFILVITRCVRYYFYSTIAKTSNINNLQDNYDYDQKLFSEKQNINTSVHSLSSNSSINILDSRMSTENLLQPSGGGKTYRNAISRSARNSLFISPTELISISQKKVLNDNTQYENSPIESPQTVHSNNHPLYQEFETYNKRKRTPSVYMEKLLDDDLSIPSSYDFDSNVHENV